MSKRQTRTSKAAKRTPSPDLSEIEGVEMWEHSFILIIVSWNLLLKKIESKKSNTQSWHQKQEFQPFGSLYIYIYISINGFYINFKYFYISDRLPEKKQMRTLSFKI